MLGIELVFDRDEDKLQARGAIPVMSRVCKGVLISILIDFKTLA